MIDFKVLAEKNHDYVVEMRRYFHAHPELSTKEANTSKKICEELDKLGLPYNTYPDYTVIATVDSGKEGKTILIRGDIDALPVQEETGLEFASQVPGVMHACGHDCHAAMLLGIAKSLVEVKDQLTGKVLIGFQVAEENLKGSRTMVEYVKAMGGADHAIATHVGCAENTGELKLFPGPFASGVITYKVYINGRGGHGSAPHAAIDPVKPACELVLKLAALPSNMIDAKDPIVFSTCQVSAGSAANIIPDQAFIFGTVRYFNKGLTQKIFDWIENISDCVAKSYGCTREVEYTFDPMLPVENDPEATAVGIKVAQEMGLKLTEPEKGMGSDDMALLVDAFPGFYAWLGCANEEKGIGHVANHNCMFTVDEDALKLGTEFLMKSTWELLNK